MQKNAEYLLREEYKRNYKIVKDSPYFMQYANEKMKHSVQVLGAGNYIIKHEPWFAKNDDEFNDLVKTAVLLHDVARFDEISMLCKGCCESLDHGVMGCEKLKKIPEYNNILITLPIKHHGHLIADFYADTEYKDIDDAILREKVEKIIFVIRDADKIANFNLMMSDAKIFVPLFVPSLEKMDDKRQEISQNVLDNFYEQVPIRRSEVKTRADHMLSYIGWIYDINYLTSIVFCQRLNLINRMFDTLLHFHDDFLLNEKMRLFINEYIEKRFGSTTAVPRAQR